MTVTVTGPITFTKGGDWGEIYSTASGITLPFKATNWASDNYTDTVSADSYAVKPGEKPQEPAPIPMPTPEPEKAAEVPAETPYVMEPRVEEAVAEEPRKRRRKVK